MKKKIEKISIEDKRYFKTDVKDLCGVEVLVLLEFIEQRKSMFHKNDYEFMRKELSKQAAVKFGQVLKAIKIKDFIEAQKALTGGKSDENNSNY